MEQPPPWPPTPPPQQQLPWPQSQVPCPPRPSHIGVFTLAGLATHVGGPPHPNELRAAARDAPSLAHSVTAAGAANFAFPPDESGGAPIGWREQHQALQAALPDRASLASEGWVYLHHRLIVWKLACSQRCFGLSPPGQRSAPSSIPTFSAPSVQSALRARYERELLGGARPAVRRLAEGEPNSLRAESHMILCIAGISGDQGAVELTDGWYTVWARCDAPLEAQLRRGRLRVGLKLRVWGCTEPKAVEDARKAARSSDANPPPPWEQNGSASAPRLELHANGTRRAGWDARLGLCRKPTFRVGLASLQPEGGRAAALHVLVARVFGPVVHERSEDKGETTSRWLSLSQARAERDAKATRLEADALARALRLEAAAEARAARRRRASRGAGGAAASDAEDVADEGQDEDDDLGERMEEKDPPRQSLVWRMALVDAAPVGRTRSLTACAFAEGEVGSDANDPSLTRLDACANASLWADFNGEEDEVNEGPVEGATGWILGANVKADASASLALATSLAASHRGVDPLPRGVGLDLPRRFGWNADTLPSRRSSVGGHNAGLGAARSKGQQRQALLEARGVGRTYTPLASLASVPQNAIFDTVGCLVFASAPVAEGSSWGAEREVRKLFLVDEALQLLCLKWVRPPSEPMPKLRPGFPLCVLDCKREFTHTEAWPHGVQLPQGLESMQGAAPNNLVHVASAEAVGHVPARLATSMPSATPPAALAAAGLAHLYPRFEELSAKRDSLMEVLCKVSAVAMDLVAGRLAPPPQPPRLSMQPPSAVPTALVTPARSAMQNSPSSLTRPTADLSKRDVAVHEGVLAQLQAQPGLTLPELIARLAPGVATQALATDGTPDAAPTTEAEAEEVAKPFSEAEVTSAVETLCQCLEVFTKDGGYFAI